MLLYTTRVLLALAKASGSGGLIAGALPSNHLLSVHMSISDSVNDGLLQPQADLM